jgi:hypothetical protein
MPNNPIGEGDLLMLRCGEGLVDAAAANFLDMLWHISF